MRRIALMCLCTFASLVIADENDWFRPLGPPPKAAPRRISGGEGVPPLPLPATPLRRTERKRDPKPPVLIAKAVWGESASFKFDDGSMTDIADWNLCPGDLQQLMGKSRNWIGQPYSSESITLTAFHADPARLPLLFFSGARSIKFDESQLALLRTYVLAGGMIVADNIAGSPYFYASFKKAMAAAFPESNLRTLPADHPLYHMLSDATQVAYSKNVAMRTPFLEAIYIGCRAGVVISKYGLGCGWDGHEVPGIKEAAYYDVASADKIGMNLVAYVVGYSSVGREEAKPEVFGALDEQRPTDELVFAQIRHTGHWNVHPGGAAALLRAMRQNTSIRTSLKRVPVTPGQDDLSRFGFLYLTGLDDFSFDEAGRTALRSFLAGTGTIVINNGLGLRTFDAAVRRELRALLPEQQLEAIPPSHPLFSTVSKVTSVTYSPAVLSEHPDLTAPQLEGIVINGDLRVIYSPYDLEAGWTGCEHPLARACDAASAAQLGVNIMMYAMTH